MLKRAARPITILAIGGLLGVGAFLAFRNGLGSGPDQGAVGTIGQGQIEDGQAAPATAPSATTSTPETTMAVPPITTTPTTLLTREQDTVPGWTVGQPWGTTPGLTMFRGNPTRTYHGEGPLLGQPDLAWRYPSSAMCGSSSVGGESKIWCGMGWTGQPVVYERDDGKTELIFGAYDKSVHFVDAETGDDLRPAFPTGDIIKGSVTLDPDGYPLIYFGSRDNLLRIVALDREVPERMWRLDANSVEGIWNNDWDGNPVIIDDIMYVGGENGWFYAFELQREYLDDGLVNVDPHLLVALPGYDNDLISKSGRNVSIESSVAVYGQRVYFGNSGGRVLGLDVSDIRNGKAPVVFDYYAGGDIDATIVIDDEGSLYVSIEHEPSQMGSFERSRNAEVGQLVKLDPYAGGDPRVWGLDLTSGTADSGIWATPALHDGVLYVNTHNGDLIAVDTANGEIVWSDPVGWHSWSSPSVIDETLVVATCLGELRGYSLANPRVPTRTWTVRVSESCLEATPAIWDGAIYIGSRDGFLRAYR